MLQIFLKSILPILFDSGIHSPVLLSTTKKEQPVAKVGIHCMFVETFSSCLCAHVCPLLYSMLQKKGHVKKHLFSDTDTENATTEVSWLRESATKSKPKVIKYSRQAPIKPRPASGRPLKLHSDSKSENCYITTVCQ